jgi:hypothetical protein
MEKAGSIALTAKDQSPPIYDHGMKDPFSVVVVVVVVAVVVKLKHVFVKCCVQTVTVGQLFAVLTSIPELFMEHGQISHLIGEHSVVVFSRFTIEVTLFAMYVSFLFALHLPYMLFYLL